jgi:hypothetical protein
MDKYAAAALLLRSGALEKDAASVIRTGLKAMEAAGKAGAKTMEQAGHKNLATAARIAPHAVAGGGAYATYKSEPVQSTIHGVKVRVERRKAKKRQKAQYKMMMLQRARQGGY